MTHGRGYEAKPRASVKPSSRIEWRLKPDILLRMLDINPQTRITISEIKSHPWCMTYVHHRHKRSRRLTLDLVN